MEKRQLNLSDKLPLSVVAETEIQCVYCGSKSYRYKETKTRKNGTQAKVFKCQQCHQHFRDNYQLSIRVSKKYVAQEQNKEHRVCPHCKSKNYKKIRTSLRKDGTTAERLQCKNCQKNFSKTYQINSLKLPLEGVVCPKCSSTDCIKSGKVNKRTQYRCKDCGRAFILANRLRKSANQWLPGELTIEEMYNYDVWDLTVLGYQKNPSHSDSTTANFAPIQQDWLKEACKRLIKLRSATLGLRTIGDKLHSIRDFSRFLNQRYPHLLANELNRQVIEDYLVYLKKKKLSASTRIHRISALRDLLEYSAAMNWVDVPKNPLIFNQDFPAGEQPLPRYIPDDVLKQYLGHNSFSMTLRYAHIHDQTLKEQVQESWSEGKIVNISGELINTNPEIDNAYNYTFKKGILGEVLANGYCALPARLTCSKGNACLQCGDFRTTLEFIDQHKEHRQRTKEALEVAKTNNWKRQIQVNEDVLNNLNNIINSLEQE